MTLRVAHVLEPEPDGEIGGADLHVLELAVAQRCRGAVEPFPVINQSSSFARRLQQAGLSYFPGPLNRPSFWRWSSLLGDFPGGHGIDLIHSHGYDANYVTAVLRLRHPRTWGRLPLVMTCHGWVETRFWQRVKTVLDFCTYPMADAFIVCSSHQVRRLVGRFPGTRVTYIPNGVTAPDDHGAVPEELRGIRERATYVLGYVGRLAPEKRVDLALLLVARLRQRLPGVHLVIVGSGPERDALRRQTAALGLERHVTFLGYQADVRPCYPLFDVLILLSVTESTSRVIIEAMLAGRPIVASDVGGNAELLDGGRCGFLCAWGDVASHADAVLTILENPELGRVMGRRASERAAALFQIERMERATAAVYAEALARRPAARAQATA